MCDATATSDRERAMPANTAMARWRRLAAKERRGYGTRDATQDARDANGMLFAVTSVRAKRLCGQGRESCVDPS